jgi:hypothetical protein
MKSIVSLFRTLLLLLICTFALLIVVNAVRRSSVAASTGSSPLSLPPEAVESSPSPLCRYGVNVVGSIEALNIASLRMGWYLNYTATPSPGQPGGAKFAPVIGLQQVGSNGYSYSPSGNQLQQSILANPGAAWFIGNEPDRRYYQDDMEPHVYARAYHELYYLIKATDPTARIVAGNIVQPTPVRLLYLDMVLSSYAQIYGQAMPVDIWGIHGFILNEVSCDHHPDNCWGAGIPPGIDWATGEVLSIDDNDSYELFKQGIVRFRQWMASRGYRNVPLYLSEYGVLMPPDYIEPPRVKAFMSNTFNYLLNETHPQLGYPADENRLVQRFSWYSSADNTFNGWLFDSSTNQRTEYGDHYAALTAPIQERINVYPVQIFTSPPAPFSQGENVTLTLKAEVTNSGNTVTMPQSIPVRFYLGNPASGGTQIGADQLVTTLPGCGSTTVVQVTWPNVPPGAYQIYVGAGSSSSINQTILVATEQVFLPIVHRPLPAVP